jgi:antitoxin component of RelBE/YafQ-DinJ toxin-antitoxin module
MAALSLKDRAADICAKLGLTSTGKLKVDVDALCEATNVPFTQMKDTLNTLSAICDLATEAVPKLCEEVGVDATGKLVDDVKKLCTEVGVDQTKFPLALKELVESMGVDIKPAKLQNFLQTPVVAAAASKQTKFKTAKIIDVPCTCDQGIDACRNCKADDHPCVCKSILIECQDQPLQLCKAKVHDCLCRVRFDGIFSKNPRISGVEECYRGYRGRTTGAAAGICRQHNLTNNGRLKTETPAKKKPRLA